MASREIPILELDTLEPAETRFQLGPKTYLLKEASGGAAIRWRNIITGSTKFNGTGDLSGLGDIAEAEAQLVCDCIREVREGEKQFPVSLQEVKGFKATNLKRMYKWLMDVSDLKEKPATLAEIDKQIAALHRQREELERAEALKLPLDPTNGPLKSMAVGSR